MVKINELAGIGPSSTIAVQLNKNFINAIDTTGQVVCGDESSFASQVTINGSDV